MNGHEHAAVTLRLWRNGEPEERTRWRNVTDAVAHVEAAWTDSLTFHAEISYPYAGIRWVASEHLDWRAERLVMEEGQ